MNRLLAYLVRLFPKAFRDRYGDEVREYLRLRSRQVRERDGLVGVVRFWVHNSVDLLRTAWAERRRETQAGSPDRTTTFGRVIPSLKQDATYALRTLVRSYGFTVMVILTLGLGIGANTAIFSVVNGVLIRALPYPNADRLVMVGEYRLADGAPTAAQRPGVSIPALRDIRDQSRALEDVAGVAGGSYLLLGGSEPEDVRGAPVTANFFRLFGVRAALGRTFRPDEDRPDAPRVVVLSDRLWRRAFGADSSMIGTTIRLGGDPFVVVGVMPPSFQFPSGRELWTLMQHAPHELWRDRRMRAFGGYARLGDDVTVEQARSELQVIATRLRERHPDVSEGWGLHLETLKETSIARSRATLLLLFGAVGLLLLIGCVNVTNLLLARGVRRQHETALRSALGASGIRVVQQNLVESLLLAAAGGVLGIVFAIWGVAGLEALSPAGIPRLDEVGVDARVLLFTALLSILTGIGVGLVPALRTSRAEMANALIGRTTTAGASHARVRTALVVVEVALTFVLLIGAGLTINSFRYLWGYAPGFQSDDVVTATIDLESTQYPDAAQRDRFFAQLLDRLERHPDIAAAGGINRVPVTGQDVTWAVRREGGGAADEVSLPVRYRTIRGDYFDVMGVPVLRGQVLRTADRNAIMVNQVVADRLWPGADPIGQRLRLGERDDADALVVVGVVGNVRHGGLDPEPKPEVYVTAEARGGGTYVVVRSTASDAVLTEIVKGAVWSIDPDQPVDAVRSMDAIITAALAGPRFYMVLFTVFGITALVLATAGLVGVVSYAVAERTHEIGVRVALGAGRTDVLRLVVGRGMVQVGTGAIIGIAIAGGVTRFMSRLLYGVHPTDPTTFAVVAALLLSAAAAALYLPARRAAAVDPVEALRVE